MKEVFKIDPTDDPSEVLNKSFYNLLFEFLCDGLTVFENRKAEDIKMPEIKTFCKNWYDERFVHPIEEDLDKTEEKLKED